MPPGDAAGRGEPLVVPEPPAALLTLPSASLSLHVMPLLLRRSQRTLTRVGAGAARGAVILEASHSGSTSRELETSDGSTSLSGFVVADDGDQEDEVAAGLRVAGALAGLQEPQRVTLREDDGPAGGASPVAADGGGLGAVSRRSCRRCGGLGHNVRTCTAAAQVAVPAAVVPTAGGIVVRQIHRAPGRVVQAQRLGPASLFDLGLSPHVLPGASPEEVAAAAANANVPCYYYSVTGGNEQGDKNVTVDTLEIVYDIALVIAGGQGIVKVSRELGGKENKLHIQGIVSSPTLVTAQQYGSRLRTAVADAGVVGHMFMVSALTGIKLHTVEGICQYTDKDRGRGSHFITFESPQLRGAGSDAFWKRGEALYLLHGNARDKSTCILTPQNIIFKALTFLSSVQYAEPPSLPRLLLDMHRHRGFAPSVQFAMSGNTFRSVESAKAVLALNCSPVNATIDQLALAYFNTDKVTKLFTLEDIDAPVPMTALQRDAAAARAAAEAEAEALGIPPPVFHDVTMPQPSDDSRAVSRKRLFDELAMENGRTFAEGEFPEVFIFVGPTGVHKSRIAREVFGTKDAYWFSREGGASTWMRKEEMTKSILAIDECTDKDDSFILNIESMKGLVNFLPFTFQAKDARGITTIEQCMFKKFVFTTTAPMAKWFEDAKGEWARRMREYATVYEFVGVRQAVRRVHATWLGHTEPPQPLPTWCVSSITWGSR